MRNFLLTVLTFIVIMFLFKRIETKKGYPIVYKITSYNKHISQYDYSYQGFWSNNGRILDIKGKYNVGDTVKFE